MSVRARRSAAWCTGYGARCGAEWSGAKRRKDLRPLICTYTLCCSSYCVGGGARGRRRAWAAGRVGGGGRRGAWEDDEDGGNHERS